MRLALFALALVAAPAYAQGGGYKLVLSWAQGGITVIDYPNSARCDAARKAVEADAKRRFDEGQARAAREGTVMVGSPWTLYALCIPG